MNGEKKLAGQLSISRVSGGGIDTVGITLVDQLSGCEILDLEMSVEDFGQVVLGLSRQKCEFVLRPENAGKIREHKTIEIPFKVSNYKNREDEARAALKPYEEDGWEGSWRDLCNMHCRGPEGYTVSFIRYVNPKEDIVQ